MSQPHGCPLPRGNPPHLGYDKHAVEGRDGGNSRNGTRPKTVLTEVGPVPLDVARDRDSSFQPQLVKKRQRRLHGVDEVVISLTSKGLTTGEVQAHLAEVYGTDVSRETVSKITDAILEETNDWLNRPLEQVYAAVFIDAIVVKVRDGRVEVTAPRVDDRREGEAFVSAILPPYLRKSPKVAEVLLILYLRGLSTGDFAPALEGFFGSDAGLLASMVNRLTTARQAEHADWAARDLREVDYVYIWAEGVHVNVRLPDADGNADRLCLLVIVCVRPDGRKELVAVVDGYREDTESWLGLLRDLRDRGMAASELAVGDGALGFWAALRQVWPSTREQRC